jgi:glyoxylase-like metal-dependent hydrolase (beta-lactamase superfamily II)
MHLGDIVRQKRQHGLYEDPGIVNHSAVIAWYLTDGKTADHRRLRRHSSGPSLPAPSPGLPSRSLAAVLERLGVDPADIEHVILTHLHWDHAGNNHLFTNAKFYVQKAELQSAVSPFSFKKRPMITDVISKHTYEILVGDSPDHGRHFCVPYSGHSVGSQSVVVDTRDGKYVIAGDLSGLFDVMRELPCSPTVYIPIW